MLSARWAWLQTARPTQLPPTDDWSTWLLLGGRGAGKTRTGAEDMGWYLMSNPGVRTAVVAPTTADARDTCVEGESGLLRVIPPQCLTAWNRSLGEGILWNGSRFKTFSAEEPDRLRGPQHHRAWADELAAWRYKDTWDQLQFGLRLGKDPRVVVTTTPRPTALVKEIVGDPGTRRSTDSTFANANNLPPKQLKKFLDKYAGTRLGRQELEAEILEDVPGAIWTRAMIDRNRIRIIPPKSAFQRIAVGVDPSGSHSPDGEAVQKGSQQGIVVVGRKWDGEIVVLADRTCQLGPEGWGRRAVSAYGEFDADLIVAESNFGGDMVEYTIRTVDKRVPVKVVRASRGKHIRAEPVAALTEQNKVKFAGSFPQLEDQLVAFTSEGYTGGDSPDRADAMIWAITELALGGNATGMLRSL